MLCHKIENLCYTGGVRRLQLSGCADAFLFMTDHDLTTRERRFAETMARVAAAMREVVVLVEEQVTSINAPHQIAMIELQIVVAQIRRDIDRLSADLTTLTEAVDRLYARERGREVGGDG